MVQFNLTEDCHYLIYIPVPSGLAVLIVYILLYIFLYLLLYIIPLYLLTF